jgi:hypothetical protein
MKNLGRFNVSASLFAALMALPCVCAAAPSSEADCKARAELNYRIAVEIDYADADMVHENTMADCLATLADEPSGDMSDAEFRAYMVRKVERDTPAGSDRRRWALEAVEHTLRCPNGYYDAANDIDICE